MITDIENKEISKFEIFKSGLVKTIQEIDRLRQLNVHRDLIRLFNNVFPETAERFYQSETKAKLDAIYKKLLSIIEAFDGYNKAKIYHLRKEDIRYIEEYVQLRKGEIKQKAIPEQIVQNTNNFNNIDQIVEHEKTAQNLEQERLFNRYKNHE